MTKLSYFEMPHLRSAWWQNQFSFLDGHCFVDLARENLSKPSYKPQAKRNCSER